MYGLQWTALMNFGGTDGIKGNMTHMNEIPFAALDAKTSVWGSGFTSEGIDQNPALCTSHFLYLVWEKYCGLAIGRTFFRCWFALLPAQTCPHSSCSSWKHRFR